VKSSVIAILVIAATASYANAGNWAKVEKPCGSKCPAVKPIDPTAPPRLTGSVTPPELIYQSRSRSVYSSNYGSSVIDGTLKIYRNPNGSITSRYRSSSY
jgi:hypothetical protein